MDDPIVATAILLLLQVWVPLVASLNVDVSEPLKHKLVVPVIGDIAGNEFTVTALVENPVHDPLVYVYVIVAEPPVTPVTIPVDDPMVAIDVLLQVQTPPVVESVNDIFPPTHTLDGPETDGKYKVEFTFTGTVAVFEQLPIVEEAI